MTTRTLSEGLSRRGLLYLGAAGALTAASPLALSRPAAAAGRDRIVIGLSQEPTVFHPLQTHIEVDDGVYFNLFSSLWFVDEAGKFQPDLAAEMPTVENGGLSADGLSWKVKLRDGVKWHDGKPFTAQDVKFTLELIVNPDFQAQRRSGHDLVTDIKVVSPTEIHWRMKSPYATYASLLAWTFIVPKHILEKQDLNNPPFKNSPVGTGPFKWKSRAPGDNITLSANKDFHRDGPFVETLIIKYIPDLTVLYTQFQAGDIDYIGLQGITADKYQQAKKLPGRKVVLAPRSSVESIALNLGLPQFKEKAVRQALYMAMDKTAIIDAIYYGLPTPTESYLPSASWAFSPDLPKQTYDPDGANKLLDQAGWVRGPDGVRAKNGVRLAFRNSTTAGNQIREQAQQLLQQNWLEIGVKMTIENLPPAVMWGDNWINSKFDSAMVGISFMVGPDPDSTEYLHSKASVALGGSGQNTTQFSSKEVDALLEQGVKEFDIEKRKQIYKKVQSIVRDELPYLFLFQYTYVEGTVDGLTGYKANPNNRINCWNVNSWKWA
jgi:peptide/nickel transport system substrate-binding protein